MVENSNPRYICMPSIPNGFEDKQAYRVAIVSDAILNSAVSSRRILGDF